MRFLVFVFAFLFIAAIFFVRDEILSKRAKIIATALIVLLCAGAYFYESASERSAKLEEEMVFKFNAGARLRCGGAINSAAETRGADAKNLSSQDGEANLNAQNKAASAARADNTRNSAVQSSAVQTSGAVSGGQNSVQQDDAQTYSPQASAQIVTRESFTYSFSLGAFIAKKSAGAEFKGKTYKIKECVYDQ